MLGNFRIQHLRHGIDDIHVMHRNHNGLTQILVPFYVRRNADFVNHGGHTALQQRRCRRFAAFAAGMAHMLQQRFRAAGLGQKITHAQLQRLCNRPLAAKSGHHDDTRHMDVPVLHLAQQTETVQPRQHNVHYQQIRLCFFDLKCCFPSVTD